MYDCDIFLYFFEFCAHVKTATLLHPSCMMTIVDNLQYMIIDV